MNNKQIKKLSKDLKNTLTKILSETNDESMQRLILKEIIVSFSYSDQFTTLNQTDHSSIHYLRETINKNFPHLKNDMEKLLLLI